MSGAAVVLVHCLIGLAMVLILPLGLRFLDLTGLDRIRRWWPVAAAAGVLSLCLPRGPVAGASASIYFLSTLAVSAVGVLAVRSWPSVRDAVVLTAMLSTAIAGLSLVAERSGYRLFGFGLTVLLLTVAHFHYAGFVAALVAALVSEAMPSRLTSIAALTVPAGTIVVALGHFLGESIELAGGTILAIGMWLVAWLTWRLRPATGAATRLLLGTSALVLVATMTLALWYAAGEAFDFAHPSLSWMASTHGLGNALGFALCGVLGWSRRSSEGRSSRLTVRKSQSPADHQVLG